MMDEQGERTRRDFVKAASLALGSLAVAGMSKASEPTVTLRETADLIVGPFYPQKKPSETDFDLTRVRDRADQASGQIIRLTGRLFDVRGKSLANRRIDIWQANANGHYDHPSDPNTEIGIDPAFQGFASIFTDGEGGYAITTIKPGPYRTARGDMRAPHIHFEVHGHIDRKTTQMFFPNEPLNDQDRHLNSLRRRETVLAKMLSPTTDSVWRADWDIVLTNG